MHKFLIFLYFFLLALSTLAAQEPDNVRPPSTLPLSNFEDFQVLEPMRLGFSVEDPEKAARQAAKFLSIAHIVKIGQGEYPIGSFEVSPTVSNDTATVVLTCLKFTEFDKGNPPKITVKVKHREGSKFYCSWQIGESEVYPFSIDLGKLDNISEVHKHPAIEQNSPLWEVNGTAKKLGRKDKPRKRDITFYFLSQLIDERTGGN